MFFVISKLDRIHSRHNTLLTKHNALVKLSLFDRFEEEQASERVFAPRTNCFHRKYKTCRPQTSEYVLITCSFRLAQNKHTILQPVCIKVVQNDIDNLQLELL